MSGEGLRELFGEGIAGAEVRFMEPMKGHTSLQIGGPVEVFISPRSAESLGDIIRVARGNGVPVLPVGGGTNLLVRDAGIEGAAVSVSFARELAVVEESAGDVTLVVGAGLHLQKLVGFCRGKGFSGIEGLVGIPGCVGGAVAGNAGAYGCEMKDVMLSMTIVDMKGEVRKPKREDIEFGYRHALLPEGAVILGAELRLMKDSPEGVSERVVGFHKRKKAQQPLNRRSAGCVFKNPGQRPGAIGQRPGFPEETDAPTAGRLIEEAGCKGMRIGDIQVSRKHANFFINMGGGSAEDYLALMEKVASRVRDAFGIFLEPEIKVVGRS
jgi:UDP-N-acetylmuramate dehydrogenase